MRRPRLSYRLEKNSLNGKVGSIERLDAGSGRLGIRLRDSGEVVAIKTESVSRSDPLVLSKEEVAQADSRSVILLERIDKIEVAFAELKRGSRELHGCIRTEVEEAIKTLKERCEATFVAVQDRLLEHCRDCIATELDLNEDGAAITQLEDG